jgi:hypothetical protein
MPKTRNVRIASTLNKISYYTQVKVSLRAHLFFPTDIETTGLYLLQLREGNETVAVIPVAQPTLQLGITKVGRNPHVIHYSHTLRKVNL